MKAPSLGIPNIPARDDTDEWLFLAQHAGLPTRLLDWSEGLFVALYFAILEKKPKIWMLDPIELNKRSNNQIHSRKHRSSSKPIDDNVFPLTWYSPDKVHSTSLQIHQILKYLIDQNQDPKGDNKPLVDLDQFMPNIDNINIRAAWELDNFGTEFPIAIHPTNIHPRMSAQKSCFTVQGLNKKSLSVLVDERVLRAYEIDVGAIRNIRKEMRMMGITRTTVFPELDSLAVDLSEIF